MACPNDDKLASLATGCLSRRRGRVVLRHLARCGDCRSRYETLAPLLRDVIYAVSERRGLAHPAPAALRSRIFGAIEADRARRSDRRDRPLLRLVPAFAAAALLLAAVFLGIRFLLRESPSVGKLYRDGGAVLVARGAEPPALQRRGSQEIRPGDILLAAPGGKGSISLESGFAYFSESLLAVVGAPDRGPALYLVRGTLSLDSSGFAGRTLRVGAGAQEPSVAGTAEIEVLPGDPAGCMGLARRISARLTRPGSFGLMRSAQADTPTTAAAPPRVRVHALNGQVQFGGGLPPITAGSQILFQADGDFQGPVLVGAESLPLSAGAGLLTLEEQRKLPALLAREEDAFASLFAAASDPGLPDPDRGLAVWLLGELGEPSVIEGLAQLLAPDRGMPAVVRAAAVRALSLLGASEIVRQALDDEAPAVVDAAIQSLGRRFPALAGPALRRVVAQRERPAFQRALAAATLDDIGLKTGLDDALSLCRSGDPHAARIGDRLLVQIGSEEARREALTILGSAGPERKTAILLSMAAASVSGAETIAQHALHERIYPTLRAAAISYLARKSPATLLPELGGILGEESGPARLAALKALLALSSRDNEDLSPFGDTVRDMLFDPDTRDEEAVIALSILGFGHPVHSQVLRDHLSPRVRRQAITFTDDDALRDALDSLIAATGDRDPELRKAAWTAVARLDPKRALDGVAARCAANPDVDIEEFLPALDQVLRPDLGEEHSRLLLAVVEPLLARATHPALRARLATLLRPPHALDLLLRLLCDEGEALAVRAVAAEALGGALNDPEARAALRGALASPHEALSSRAALALNARRRLGTVPAGLAGSFRGAPRHDYARAVVALLDPVDTGEVRALLSRSDTAATALLLSDAPPDVLSDMPEAVLAAARSGDAGVVCLALRRLPATAECVESASAFLSSLDPFIRLAAEGVLLRSGSDLRAERLRSTLHQAAGTRHGAGSRELLDQVSGAREIEDLLRSEGAKALGSRLLALAVGRDAQRLASLAARFGLGDWLSRTLPVVEWRSERAVEAGRQAALDVLAGGAEGSERARAIRVLEGTKRRADVGLLIEAALDGDPEVRGAAGEALFSLLSRGGVGPDDRERSDIEGWWRPRAYALEVPVVGNGNVEYR